MSITFEGNSQDLRNFVIKAGRKRDEAYESYLRATSLCMHNLYKESVKHYLTSIFKKRNNPESYLGLAIAHRHLGDLEKSTSYLEKAMEYDSKNPNILSELGITCLCADMPELAISNFQYSITLNKSNLETQLHLGVTHEYIGEYEMALMIYQRIIEEEKSYIPAYNHKAALLIDLKMYVEAGQVFKEIIKINPNYAKAYLGLGIIYEKLDKKGMALRYYREYLKLKPHSRHAQKLKDRIFKIKFNHEFKDKDCQLFLLNK